MRIKPTNKFRYLSIVQSSVNGAWVDRHTENKAFAGYRNRTRTRTRTVMANFAKTEGGIYRVISRKVPNPDYWFKGAL